MPKPDALVVDFDEPGMIEEIYLDPPESDGDGEFTDQIEEAMCPSGSGLCTYLDNRCVTCGEPAPWVRNACGQM